MSAAAPTSTGRRSALVTVLAVLFLTFLDTTVVSVTLGDLQFDLGAGVIPLQWVVNAYSLVFASLMLLAGSLGDRYGRARVMVVGIAIFCLGSLMCALASDVSWVIAGRAVMGVGAAASEPGTLSVLRQLFPDRRERARAIGAWAAVSGLSLALGPVVGGLLVAAGGWRAVFWANLAVGAVVLVAAQRFVPDSADPDVGPIDRLGALLGAAGLGCGVFAVIAGEQYGYRTWWIDALAAAAVVGLVAFVAVERRAASPVLDLAYLADPAVRVALFVAFAAYFGVFAIFFLTALYLDVIVGYSGAELAGMFAPMAVAIVAGSVLAGRWVAARGARPAMASGCVVVAIGLVAARYLLTTQPQRGWLAVVLAVSGAGFGVAVVPLTAAVLGHVPARRSGMAASATNTARQLGAVLGVASLGAIVNGVVTRDFTATLQARGQSPDSVRYIIDLIRSGGDDARQIDLAHPPPLIADLVDAATAAFRTGLHLALFVAAALMLTGALATLAVRTDRFAAAPDPA